MQSLVETGGTQFAGGLLLGLVLLGAGGYARRHLMERSKLWIHACPECGSYDLRRSHRRRYERMLTWLGLPIRRYRCPKCHWSGPRLGSS